jgi:ABC-type glycerol-3-phosphate transport system permease component
MLRALQLERKRNLYYPAPTSEDVLRFEDEMFLRQQYIGSWNYIMAAWTVVALPTIVMFVVFQKRLIESIKTSGIK